MLPTRGRFIVCLASFDIIEMGLSPYLTFALVFVTLWSRVAVIAMAIVPFHAA